ncbi:MAG: hypothetical protein LIO87_11425, partial [Eubacterium sp.]|nr:hypothetical protein [Eubacterium sp.]
RDSENYKSCLKLIDVLTASDLSIQERLGIMKNEFSIKITKNIEDEVMTMCNVSYGIERKGEIKGTEKTTVSLLKNAMNNLHLTLEQALTGLGIPESDYQKYRSLIEG